MASVKCSPDLGFLQNLPSIVCCHVLNPQPGQKVLDMCASPGNKTSHLGALMKNEVFRFPVKISYGNVFFF